MDFTDIGKLIGGIAPTIATALGGPLAGAAVEILAGHLGVSPDKSAVGDAIKAGGPGVVEAIQKAEADASKRWDYLIAGVQSDAQQASEVNQTMRSENEHGISWWHWRHLLGYVVGGWVAGTAVAFVKHMWLADSTAIANVANLLNSGFGYFGAACGLLGYVAMDNTRRMAGQQPVSLIGSLLQKAGKK